MTLLPDWKSILRRAWSVKFMALVVVLSGCETLLQLGGTSFLPSWLTPAVIGLLSAFGILARALAQKEAEHAADE